MKKNILMVILILILLACFISAIVSIKRGDLNPSADPSDSPQNSFKFIPPTIQSKSNNTQDIASEARSGNIGVFVPNENNKMSTTTATNSGGVVHTLYKISAYIGYGIIFFIGIMTGRYNLSSL
jgi:ABC-type cobalt transport system substrate-binding protein